MNNSHRHSLHSYQKNVNSYRNRHLDTEKFMFLFNAVWVNSRRINTSV